MKFLLFILLSLPFNFLLWDILNGNLIDPIEEITNPTGEWGLNFLLLTLAITPLSKITGFSFIKYRRMIGLGAFFYTVLHLSIFLIDKEFSLLLILDDIIKRPYITVGFTAFVLLVLLAITSTNAWMRRLKKNWHKLHKTIYIIAVLVIVHFYWQVKSIMDFEPLIYTIITVVLLLYRFINRKNG